MRTCVVELITFAGTKVVVQTDGTRMVVRMRVYVSIRSIFVKGMPDLLKDNHEPYIVVAMLPRIEGEHHITTAHERRYEAHV